MNRQDLIEKIAELQHTQWSDWTRWMLEKRFSHNAKTGEMYIDRWRRQMNTSYDELTDDERENDRIEARKVLEYIEKELGRKIVR